MKKIFFFTSSPNESANDTESFRTNGFEVETTLQNQANSLINCIQDTIKNNLNDDYVIICTSYHQFTPHFSMPYLNNCIENVQKLGGNLLLGGLLGFEKAMEVTDHIFWVDGFKGAQFIVIFKKAFALLLQSKNADQAPAELFLSQSLDDIFVMHPFISIYDDQDINSFENTTDFADIHENPEEILDELSQIKKYYSYEPK
ncbi:hypothetical protein [Chryseobacterium lathyri]|uniref:hypothetical protein n=1 Tax=Chryseobacterium lathyri TaxID=395933 RepID=UPI00278AB36A|nr:hypothetical protein [Chryseobacterium lathyri]MDQ0066753.1 hypothetical protein [Chryseobacterium lathyri]